MSVESVESAGAAIGAEVRESSEVLSGTTAASKSMEGRAEGACERAGQRERGAGRLTEAEVGQVEGGPGEETGDGRQRHLGTYIS